MHPAATATRCNGLIGKAVMPSNRECLVWSCVLCTLSLLALATDREALENLDPSLINLDGGQLGWVYDGHGALSAGASSRLLFDYPEPQVPLTILTAR